MKPACLAALALGAALLLSGAQAAAEAEQCRSAAADERKVAGASLIQSGSVKGVKVTEGSLPTEDAAAVPSAAAQELHDLALSASGEAPQERVAFRKCMAEFIAMTLFVIVGCGSACGVAKAEGSAWILQVALTFGFAITVLAYTIGHYSGGQINCAVTFGLVLAGQVTVAQGLANFVAQCAGSVFGALILRGMYSEKDNKDLTHGLGSNGVGEGWSKASALLGETVCTFVLMYVVLETAVNPMSVVNRSVAPIAIGLAVFLAHSVLIPIDGCSINPTRSLGPAVVASLTGSTSTFNDMWIFWTGPLLGSALAVLVYSRMTA